jgi:hypothetical protein
MDDMLTISQIVAKTAPADDLYHRVMAELATYSDQHILDLFAENCEYIRENGFSGHGVRPLVADVITATLIARNLTPPMEKVMAAGQAIEERRNLLVDYCMGRL